MKYITRNHQEKLAKWNPDERVLARVRDTGFDRMYLVGSHMRSDLSMFSAFASCFSLENNCFVLGNRRLVITLDDVARIMGLPVDGKAVTGSDFKKDECRALCLELLGSEEFAAGKALSHIVLSSLLGLMVVPNDVEGEGMDTYVRAYVLHQIGCFVCPSSDKNKVPSMFLGLLRNIDNIKDYAWGAAFLAHNMSEMRYLAENRGVTTTVACVPFFMVFLFEYVNGIALASARGMADVVAPLEFPLIVSWSILMGPRTRNNYGKLSEERYRELLLNNEITWRPYERLAPDFLPIPLRSQLDVAYSHTILICFSQLAVHLPEICPAKLGLCEDDVVVLQPLPTARSLRRTNPDKPDWGEKFAEQVEAWNQRRLSYICSVEKLVDLKVLHNDAVAAAPALEEGVVQEKDCIFANPAENLWFENSSGNEEWLGDFSEQTEVLFVDSEQDAGVLVDTLVEHEAGVLVDSLVEQEAGVLVDSLVEQEAGVLVDSSTEQEAGVQEAGVLVDSSMEQEAGLLVGSPVEQAGLLVGSPVEQAGVLVGSSAHSVEESGSPMFSVNTAGERRGKRMVRTPVILKEDYELDKARLDRIRRGRK